MAYLQEYLFLVEHYFREGGNYSDAMKQLFRERFFRSEVPSEDAVRNVIAHFMRTGTVHQAATQPELSSALCRGCHAVLTESDGSTDDDTDVLHERPAKKKRTIRKRTRQSLQNVLKRKAAQEERYDSDTSESSETMAKKQKLMLEALDPDDLWTELSEDENDSGVGKGSKDCKSSDMQFVADQQYLTDTESALSLQPEPSEYSSKFQKFLIPEGSLLPLAPPNLRDLQADNLRN